MFKAFSCPCTCKFGVQFSQLLDTLNIFSSAPAQADITMAYPGPNGELTFE